MIPSQRDLFDIPRDRVYLNTAYMGPMPKSAIAAGQESYAAKGQPWARLARISKAGRVLPSSTSRKAPPPVEM